MQDNKNRSTLTYFFSGLAVFLIVAGAVVWWQPHTVLGLFYTDIETVEDTPLELQTINVPEGENVFFDLNRLASSSDKLSQYSDTVKLYANDESWNQDKAQTIINNTQKEQHIFSAAAQKRAFQDPDYRSQRVAENHFQESVLSDNPQNSGYSMDLHVIRETAWLHSVKARLQANSGNYDSALETALKNIQVGERMMESQSPWMYFLVGRAVHKQGQDSVSYVINSLEGKPPKNLSQVVDRLRSPPISENSFV